MPHLTPKQAAFVREYLIDLNATQAAARAGYSERTANQAGPRLLTDPNIRGAIDVAMADRSERTLINADWLLTRLVDEATADLADLYTSEGSLKPVQAWPPIWRQGLVQGLEIEELFEGSGVDRIHIGHVKKVRLDNRIRRLELIGRHIGVKAFEETVTLKGFESLAERLDRAIKRDAPDLDGIAIEIEADELSHDDQPAAPAPVATLPRVNAPPTPAPPPQPPAPRAYLPILPAYPDQPSSVDVDYDPLSKT